jgi:hypothetical protein
MNMNSREGQRRIAKNLATRLGIHLSTRRLRKLQAQAAISAMLNRWHIEQCANGDLRIRRP